MRSLIPLLALACAAPGRAQDAPMVATDHHGFARNDYSLAGRGCAVIAPREAHPDRPWVLRVGPLDEEPAADLALLAAGFHVASIDVSDLYGAPRAVELLELFHASMLELGLDKRPALEAYGRDALGALNFAHVHPERVACVYAASPVCDVKSWPAGLGKAAPAPAEWARCKAAWGLDDEGFAAFDGNPIDNLMTLADGQVPLLVVAGAADGVVPPKENAEVLARRYRDIGGPVTLVLKPGAGPTPRGLEDTARVLRFVRRHALERDDFIEWRGGLDNFKRAVDGGALVRVGFLGGSLTANPGWRELVCMNLGARYGHHRFEFLNAGVPSMGSTPGAFRLERDLLGRGPLDLLVVEAAVNDSTNGRTPEEMLRGMEGIVRRALAADLATDVLLVHFADPEKLAAYAAGRVPTVIEQHERVAAHYGLPSVDVAREVHARIEEGEFTWERDIKDVHPSMFGQRVYWRALMRVLDRACAGPALAGPDKEPRALPAPLDEESYDAGRMLGLDGARLVDGWRKELAWRPAAGATRAGFVDVPALVREEAGGELALTFRGRAIGVLVAAGPDAGVLEFAVDGGTFAARPLFTRWSAGLHLPWVHVLTTGLDPTQDHELVLRVGTAQPAGSAGRAVRILDFVVNE
jgi:sialidase-1